MVINTFLNNLITHSWEGTANVTDIKLEQV